MSIDRIELADNILRVIEAGFVVESKTAYGPNIWKTKDGKSMFSSEEAENKCFVVQLDNDAKYATFKHGLQAADFFVAEEKIKRNENNGK